MYTHLHILPQGRTAHIRVNEVTDSTKERARKVITDQSETRKQTQTSVARANYTFFETWYLILSLNIIHLEII